MGKTEKHSINNRRYMSQDSIEHAYNKCLCQKRVWTASVVTSLKDCFKLKQTYTELSSVLVAKQPMRTICRFPVILLTFLRPDGAHDRPIFDHSVCLHICQKIINIAVIIIAIVSVTG